MRRLQTLQDLVLGGPGGLGHRRDGRRTPQLLRELPDEVTELQVQLLQTAGDPDRPALVAEVALQLADDGRCGVGGELDLTVRVEPVDRLHQADRSDLHEILNWEGCYGLEEPPEGLEYGATFFFHAPVRLSITR